MATKHRSPSYPAIDLAAAVDLVIALYPEASRHPVGAEVVANLWKYKSVASASPYISSLKQFGLMTEKRSGGDRMLQLSDAAKDIAVDYQEGNSSACQESLAKSAKSPKIFSILWEKWGGELPPDGEIRRYLQREREFNPKYVGRVVANYRATLEFAKLDGSAEKADPMASESDVDSEVDTSNNGNVPETPKNKVRVGSFVQWTSQGQDRFQKPRKVLMVSEDGEYAFVENTQVGIPMSELTVVDAPCDPSFEKTPPVNPLYEPLSSTDHLDGPEVRFPLEGGNEVVIRLKKPVSKKDFDRIGKLLELAEDSLVASASGDDSE